MNGQEYLDLLKTRYSVRSFSDVQLTDAELDVLLQAAQLSPTAKNSQPFRLCVVQSAEGLAKIDEATRCRYGAPTVIIGAYDTSVSAKGLGYETGDFGDIDTSIVLTNIANAAAAENLGSCWVGAYDSAIIRKNFNIPNNYVLVDLMMGTVPRMLNRVLATIKPSRSIPWWFVKRFNEPARVQLHSPHSRRN